MSKMTTCKTCGENVAKSASVCPKCGAKLKRRHPVIGIIIAIFGFCLLTSALSNFSDSEPKKVGDAENQQQTEQKEEQKTTFYVGDVVALNDIEVTFVSCKESKGKQFLEPDDGNVFVLCEFAIDNKSEKDIAISSIVSFQAYVDDYSTPMSLSATMSTDKQQLDGAVAAGKKMSGAIGYEVPKDWKELEIRFTPDFWSAKDITFVATH